MKFIFILLVLMPLLAFGGIYSNKEKFKDGPCMDWKQAPEIDAAWLKDVKSKGLYYQMGSKLWYYTITEALTGKPPANEFSSFKACLSNIAGPDGFLLRGYGNKAHYKCTVSSNDKHVCLPTEKSTNITWAAKRGTTEATMVWVSADEQYLLGFRCVENQKIWALRSTKMSPVDHGTIKFVEDFVKKEGFNPEMYLIIPQYKCPEIEPYPA